MREPTGMNASRMRETSQINRGFIREPTSSLAERTGNGSLRGGNTLTGQQRRNNASPARPLMNKQLLPISLKSALTKKEFDEAAAALDFKHQDYITSDAFED